jgi:hypothetical protein
MASRNKEINPLHSVASYNTIFTLSGISEQEIRSKNFLTNAPHDIIARSGGIGPNQKFSRASDATDQTFTGPTGLKNFTDAGNFVAKYEDSISILKRSHDMFIENVNMLSTVGPNAERNLANFTKMEFEVHEPYGITLIEKVRAATALNGFQDYQDAPLLLTIEFKGFDEQGQGLYFGGYNKKMTSGSFNEGSFSEKGFQPGLVRKIPILIARVDFDVNEGGAKYQVIAVPYTDLVFDDRFKFPRTKLPVASNNAEQWAIDVAAHLDRQMDQEVKEKKRELKDTYIFKIDPEVIKNGGVYKSQSDTIHQPSTAAQHQELLQELASEELAGGQLSGGQAGAIKAAQQTATVYQSYAEADSFTALTKFFEDAVRQSFGYISLVQNFWEGYLNSLGNEVSSKDPEGIRKILESKKFAEDVAKDPFVPWFKIKGTVQTHKEFDNITKMSRKTIIYRAMPYKIHILKLIGSGMSIKADWSKYVRKEYNYLYTGDNLDVQNLRINYKTAYYMRNVREAKDTTETGQFMDSVKSTITELFGKEQDPEPTLPLRQYPSILKGRSTIETTNLENVKAQEFYDYLTNPEVDMMRIELEILGDPAYICQDIYMPVTDDNNDKIFGNKGEVFDTGSHSFNADQFMPCINLRYRLPDDIDENEGTMFGGTQKFRDENLFFSGVYQVVKVDSKFDNGQFLQTLTCVRMNNQSGEGAPISLVNSARKGTNDLESAVTDNINKAKKIKENLKKKEDDKELLKDLISGKLEI